MQVPVTAASHLTVHAQGSSQNRSQKHHKHQEVSPPERENESQRYMGGQVSHQYSGLRPIDNDSFSEDEVDHEEEEASLDFNAIQMNQMQQDVEEEEDEY